MKNILITGGHGFLGSHLREALAGEACFAPRSREVNLLELPPLTDYLQTNDIDTVIHAAGFVGGIGLNKAHPGRMVCDNLRMGLNVLEAAARKGGVNVCIVSTVCVYPEFAPIPTPESAMFDGYPAGDTAFYGLAKRSLLTVAEGLARESGLKYSYVIPTNLYGPGDYFDDAKSHVVPALIKRALHAKETSAPEFVAWGDGSQTRDLLYVKDATDGVLAALRPEALGQVFNLGSGIETSVKELVETICEVVGYQGNIVWDTTKPGGAPRRALDATKAREILDFVPKVSLKDGLKSAFEWYLENRN